MKKIRKMQINPARLLKNKELMTIQGGYGWAYCMSLDGPCGNWPVPDCGLAAVEFCDRACPGWTSISCFDRE
ncbi:MAG: hypothetical protein ACOXZU_06760 [Bacteroidales bacterium]|jgi:hypothetical protein